MAIINNWIKVFKPRLVDFCKNTKLNNKTIEPKTNPTFYFYKKVKPTAKQIALKNYIGITWASYNISWTEFQCAILQVYEPMVNTMQ